MNNENILEVYENVATITNQMLAAAKSKDWDQLALLESRCSDQVEILKRCDPIAPLTGERRDRKVEIIRKILKNDYEIRSLTEPWMKQLSFMMQSTGTERKLAQFYGSGQKD